MSGSPSGSWKKWLLAASVAALALAGCGSSSPRSSSSTTTSGPSSPGSIAPHLALWPFRTAADVQSWQQQYSSGGTDAWHLSADTTALNFTMNYLGFTQVNAVVNTTTDATGAHVSVGFHPSTTVTSTSAVVHLVRWGTGSSAPWEVVGTDDTTLSLTKPAYGATVSSPLTAGGTITGVDENISITVRQPSTSAAIGSFCCTPAGGSASPWAANVSFVGATDPVLTVTAVTGGHVQAVERFAVTGVRSTG